MLWAPAVFVARRLAEGAGTLITVVVVTFILIHVAPGDPAIYAAGISAPPGFLVQLRHQMGLDQPIPIQLLIYLKTVLHGDFGYSYFWNTPVNAIILSRLPATLLLIATSWVISTVGGVVIGVLAARAPFTKRDGAFMMMSLAAYSIPQFWVGILLILLFGVWLGWLPTQGIITSGADYTGITAILDVGEHLILPALALGLTDLAIFSRVTRISVLEVSGEDFIRTARSKGISENDVFVKHALRNALLPLVTLIGIRFRNLIAGAVLIEAIFSWPGVGLLTLQSLTSRDYPLILAITFWAAALVVAGNFLTDVVYRFVDPRVGTGASR